MRNARSLHWHDIDPCWRADLLADNPFNTLSLGCDFLRHHALPLIDFATAHLWPDTWLPAGANAAAKLRFARCAEQRPDGGHILLLLTLGFVYVLSMCMSFVLLVCHMYLPMRGREAPTLLVPFDGSSRRRHWCAAAGA